ncbi:uncharacterized protein J4E78_007915 [Alternaria triticimaculans]|uniref:uncharacterized protein n=1 Tax=Alternaria triticimaculans TaxID=297637 RepID=UPI0020C406F8|nr:uncharacterized protein J4E78_007915 [Alternaria triticimaculans]KAI4651224.1 hypothetical protein J4E78_007915 [Alternaria triticimaculans]
MSTRKSGRATKAVKYTSASEGSDFEDKKRKPRKTSTATPKKPGPTKRTKAAPNATTVSGKKALMNPKRPAESDNDDDNASANETAPKPKRQKKDPETLANEAHEKQVKADKALHKQNWQDWLAAHTVEGEMLEEEPDKEESITQTDALKKYGLKKEELTSLLRYEKKNPLYGGTMKLFIKDNVKELCFRKMGMLEGVQGGDGEVLRKGEEIWQAEHKDDPETENEAKSTKVKKADKSTPTKEKKDAPAKPEKSKKEAPAKPTKPTKEKTPKQKWSAYISSHTLAADSNLTEEPSDVINQTECKNKYSLTPQDLACLSFFPKKNPVYGKIMKLFHESEVKKLAYVKTAVLAGVEDDGEDEGALVKEGKKIVEEQREGEDDEEE